MSRTKHSWRFFLGMLGTGMMSVTAYGQQTIYSNGVVSPAPVAAAIGAGYQDMGSMVGSCNGGCDTGSCGCSAAPACAPRDCSGDPWTLFGRNCDEPTLNIGGWFSAGYHTDNNGLFNNHAGDLNLHQSWLFVEKAAKSENGELGFGFRFDGMYGIDAPDTQAFGNPGATWDLDPRFQRGAGFGWALPQAYGEIAKGDWNVKVGHFYTLIGYEVVTAPDNFFYSHAMTMYNSEPFTHTGVIASKAMGENTTVYGGWTAGWDSGFDFSAGSNFLGGFSTQLDPDVSLTYMTTFGNFGARSANNNDAYSHSIVLDMAMSENLNTIVQSDLTRIASTGEDSVGLAIYNIYQINSCLSVGSRTEWWKGDDIIGYNYGGLSAAPVSSTSYYSSTYGLNYKVNQNVTIRPEYRYDRSPALDYDQGYFGFDVVATF